LPKFLQRRELISEYGPPVLNEVAPLKVQILMFECLIHRMPFRIYSLIDRVYDHPIIVNREEAGGTLREGAHPPQHDGYDLGIHRGVVDVADQGVKLIRHHRLSPVAMEL